LKIRCLTREAKARIVGMHQGGMKGIEIVAALGHSKSTVSTIFEEFEHCGSVEYPRLTGYPQKLSERNVRVIISKLLQD
jgi:transposase